MVANLNLSRRHFSYNLPKNLKIKKNAITINASKAPRLDLENVVAKKLQLKILPVSAQQAIRLVL